MDLSPKEFELLLCEFCKQDLPQHFKVEHDIKDIGGESGGRRQIDTKIKGRIGISDILICGEAKNWNNEVGSETIDALVGKYFSGEIRANKVILFSNSGYTEPAIKRAKLLGIELLQPKEIGKPIKIVPYVIGIGYLGKMTLRLVGKTVQHTIMSLKPDDYNIIKGEEKISFQQNVFRLVKSTMRQMRHKDIFTYLSRLELKDSNVLYELRDKERFYYTADFEIDLSLIWDYFVEYLSAGILQHVNTGRTIFVNLQGHPGEVLKKVIMSPTKVNFESKEELIGNVISKNEGHVLIFCMPDPDRHKTHPQEPIFSFV